VLTISKPLSASQAQAYHSKEFTSAEQAYYSQKGEIRGEWHGKLAEQWGLHGDVTAEQFQRLSEGQHPITGKQLVRHQTPREYTNEQGELIRTMEHRAGWDATFSAPKTVSLTALVGGDERVRDAHEASVNIALNELENYVQARIGGNHPAQTIGKWAAAKFEHDSARPVDGYAAPQLHTHVVFFNVTEMANGETRALQPRELYRTQQYATAVYRGELAARLRELGYEIERGRSGQPEIKGYSKEYIEASSPRRRQITEHLAEEGVRGAGAAQIAAHRTRDAKSALSAEEMFERHRVLAEQFGNQPEHVVQTAKDRAHQVGRESVEAKTAQTAITFSKERNLEREAIADERELLRDALKRSMGQMTLHEVRADFEKRVTAGEFIQVEQRNGAPGRAFTTTEMLAYERDVIHAMRQGQDQHEAIATIQVRSGLEDKYSRLSESQRKAVDQVLSSRDQVTALDGVAGAGKTTSLAAIREAAEREGYQVRGFAPTSRAAQKLGEAGIESSTLQRHLVRGKQSEEGERHLYVLDESSLASTKQMHEFLHRLKEDDRVLLVGDIRQHQGVEAGRPFEQLQEAGMRTAHLDEIVRQRDPALKHAVEQLARGEVQEALADLQKQGRVHEIADPQERIAAVAKAFVERSEETLVVSPDNKSRRELNEVIHRELQTAGKVADEEHSLRVLVSRQEMTGADRQWAAQYEVGDIVRYSRGSEAVGIEAGEYVTVRGADADQNLLTVEKSDGEQLTYDPRRLHGVSVYKEDSRDFSEGDRVQFTAPYREEGVANRELGTVTQIDSEGNLQIHLDSGRDVQFSMEDQPHLDYGYAVTSHSSQGLTANRVLVHVDTEAAHENLVNARLGYVSVSRARDDAQIYTNDAASLSDALSRDVSKPSALDAEANTDADRSREHANEEQHDPHESAHSRVESEQAEGHANEEQRAPHESDRSQAEQEHMEEREQAQEHGAELV
jgi:conjugative relaxase-like TrwC/TraI family protein